MKQRFAGFVVVFILTFVAYLLIGSWIFSLELTSDYVIMAVLQSIVFSQLVLMLLPVKGIPELGEPVGFKLKGDPVYYGVVIERLYNRWFTWSVVVKVTYVAHPPAEYLIGKKLTVTNKTLRMDSVDTMWMRFCNRIALAFVVMLVVSILRRVAPTVSLLGIFYFTGFLVSLFWGMLLPDKIPAVGEITKADYSAYIVIGRVINAVQMPSNSWSIELEILALGSLKVDPSLGSSLQGKKVIVHDNDLVY